MCESFNKDLKLYLQVKSRDSGLDIGRNTSVTQTLCVINFLIEGKTAFGHRLPIGPKLMLECLHVSKSCENSSLGCI